jgi:glutathione S-transferase
MTDTDITLHGMAGSTCTAKVLTTLEEKGLGYTLNVVNLMKGEQKSAEHMARQPFGVIPAITLDGFTMYESGAIIRYLDRRFPETPLTPKSHKSQAMMEQFMAVEYGYLGGPHGQILYQRILNPMRGQPVDEAAIEKAREALARVFTVLDATLASQPYLAGETFSLADLVYLPALGTLHRSGDVDLIAANPAVAAWAERISVRPSWTKVKAMSAR